MATEKTPAMMAARAAGQQDVTELLIARNVDPAFAKALVEQQLEEFVTYQGVALFSYGKRQLGPRHYDELVDLLMRKVPDGSIRRAATNTGSAQNSATPPVSTSAEGRARGIVSGSF